MITLERLQQFSPASLQYFTGLVQVVDYACLDTPLRLQHFMSQIAHESGGFKFAREGMNYSWEALRRTFPKYFPNDNIARQYARQPEKIGNRVYANRMGNGDEASGDGYKFSGKGLIQLTGKDNVRAYSKDRYGDERLLLDPSALTRSPDAVLSAGWFWKKNKINELAGNDDLEGVTRRINGGLNGLDDRREWLTKAKRIFK